MFDGKEEKVVQSLNSRFKNGELFPFLPTKEKWFIGRGKKVKEKGLLFPGYVFIETALAGRDFLSLTRQFIDSSSDIIRLLKNSDSDDDFAIKESERTAWLYLLGKEKCVEASVGFMEDDKIYIEYGSLKGLEGIIKKINRHKREATIETQFMGRLQKIDVALQIIKKV